MAIKIKEKVLNKRKIFIEEYKEMFILANFTKKYPIYAGKSLIWTATKNVIFDLFGSKEEVLKTVTKKPHLIIWGGVK